MKVDIEVTAEDINAGIPECDTGCPIALAVRRSLGLHPIEGEVVVNIEGVYVNNPDASYMEAELPADAQDFVEAFDYGDDVTPIKFRLDFTEAKAGS